MKTILLTGACGSIGNSIIKFFYKRYKLICLDKDKKKLSNLKKKYKKIIPMSCNLTKQVEVLNVLNKIKKRKIAIDILINNAGKIYNEPIVKIGKFGFKCHNYKSWINIINTNLNSTFLFSSNVIEYLCNTRQESLIINISSISALGNKGQSAYSASKSAVETLTKVWAKELSNFKIRVACISPGFFDTESTSKSLNKNHIDNLISNTPSKRMGKKDELINAINFVINNKFFNGKILNLDGGLVL